MKRLVICADGTWNIRDQVDEDTGKRRPTNVTKVARAVLTRSSPGAPNHPRVDQVVFYHDGVGTNGGLDKYTGGAFGRGIEDNVRSLYRSIVYNYDEGDELFFFGFSRGAFTVRTLGGFMKFVGLLQKDDDYYLPEIYGCYEKGKGPGTPEWQRAFHNVKDTRPCPPIKFLGVWDTVGALGAPGLLGHLINRGKYEYHNIQLHDQVLNACQALAIDERRKPFAPSVWERPAGWTGTLEQAWFPGVHSDVGGSYTPDGLANEALHWLIEKAERLGLEFAGEFLKHYRPCFNSKLHDSMSVKYRLLGTHVRPIGRTVGSGETIHQAALDRMNLSTAQYRASNLLAYREANPTNAPANTTRVPRGEPC